ncbi:MAG: hypothetical protein J7500_12900 [Sphingomonas sp.]|uniref:hypothetical protein n=1 Tax=Sphingomonas sp. TaxID=28214 RepID=UPI001B26A526|nr:hypothetical protein [Sphingomonas sp.]MBO9623600.1 hypothetical protein [Sphingomonas sp.]
MTRLRFLLAAVALAGAAQPAVAQHAQVSPYIEATQVLAADLGDGSDVFTYTTVGAGIDAALDSRRVQVQVSYKYEHRFSYDKQLADEDMHTGLAQARATVAPGLTLEAGAIAAHARADVRGDASLTGQGNVRNRSQVFSAYAGPNLATHVGPAFVNAAYRFGYTKVEAPDATGVPAGQPALDRYDDSRVHVATASVGVKSGQVLPVGITASGSYTREDAGQLDQRFEGKFGRGDVVLPVGRGFALTAGVGYEQIEISQRDALRDGAGNPVVDRNGRFVTDPASPRRIAYDFDGIFWDAGVIWRPSRRTFLEARVGRRYDSWSYTGSFSYQMGRGSGIQVGVYDNVQTFGQQLSGTLATLPTSFISTTDPFGNQFGGCIYGTTGAAAGGCLNQVFASTVTTAYRGRGIVGVAVANTGRSRFGIGAGYSRRTFIAPSTASVGGIRIDGSSDDALFAQFFASEDVGTSGVLSTAVFGSWYNSSLPGAEGILGYGANTSYTHNFGPLGATASLGVFGFERDGDSSAQAQALVGLRYGF